jgi:hypothetical protein
MQNQSPTLSSGLTKRLAVGLREYEHRTQPWLGTRLINFLRQGMDFERRFLHDPLRTVPELSGRVSRSEQMHYGAQAKSHQAIADALVRAIEYIKGAAVAGEVIEFGTMSGRTASVLAAAMASFRHPGELHLLDSFAGMPEAKSDVDKAAMHVQSGAWAEGTLHGISAASLREKCRRYLPNERIVVHSGWFSETAGKIDPNKRFGLLHVDCDLYQSTRDALTPLFAQNMVSEGAVILFDDWNCNRASNQLGERRAWCELGHEYAIETSDGGDYSWSGHKFIVHKYRSRLSSNSDHGLETQA